MASIKGFLYRLFFTRDDDLDMLQIFYLAAVVFFAVAFRMEAVGIWQPSDKAWDLFRLIFILLAISGTPVWIAKLIAARTDREREE